MLKILASTALVSVLATGVFAQEAATPPATPMVPADPAAPLAAPADQAAQENTTAPALGAEPTTPMQAQGEPATPVDPMAPAVDPAPMQAQEAPGATPMVPGAEPSPMQAQDVTPAVPADPILADREGWETPPEGYTRVAIDTISADQLIGANITSADGETIASIDDVTLSADGRVENVVAAFGGFLGFGQNTVLLTMDEIDVLEDDTGALIVHTNLTPEALEGRPTYEAPPPAN